MSERKCRTCGDKIFILYPKNIFSKENEDIRQKIELLIGLELHSNNDSHKHICSCCLLNLNNAIAFRKLCLKTHEELEKDLKMLKEETEIDSDPLNEPSDHIVELQDEDAFFSDVENEEVDYQPMETRAPNSKYAQILVKRLPRLTPPAPAHPAKKKRKSAASQEKRYVCEFCGWSFSDLSNMKDHKRRHLEGKFACSECDRKFYTNPLLKLHVRVIHNGEKPFVCQYCGQGFPNSPSRCRHVRSVHPNQLPFECKICHKTFISKISLDKHEPIHEGGKPQRFYCETCNKEFKANVFLKHHYETKYHRRRANEIAEDVHDYEGTITNDEDIDEALAFDSLMDEIDDEYNIDID